MLALKVTFEQAHRLASRTRCLGVTGAEHGGTISLKTTHSRKTETTRHIEICLQRGRCISFT